MTPRPTDRQRSAVYAAERMVFGLFDNVGSTRVAKIGGTNLTLPAEAKFASLDSIRRHVEGVLSLPAVIGRFPRAAVPVQVRARRGVQAATYEAGEGVGVIAIPESASGRWALRELVVLHELAHHLDDSGEAAHGPPFRVVLVDLVEAVLGAEAAFAYRVIFGECGL